MLNIQHHTISKAEFDADDALLFLTSDEQAEAIARLHGKGSAQEDTPTTCPCCSRPLVHGDCDPCQISFTMPF